MIPDDRLMCRCADGHLEPKYFLIAAALYIAAFFFIIGGIIYIPVIYKYITGYGPNCDGITRYEVRVDSELRAYCEADGRDTKCDHETTYVQAGETLSFRYLDAAGKENFCFPLLTEESK